MIIIYISGNYTRSKFEKVSLENYKTEVFQKISQLSLDQFQNTSTSSFLSGLSNDILSLKENYLESVVEVIPNLLTSLFSLIMLVYYSPLLTLIVVIATCLPVLFSMKMANIMVKKELSDGNDQYTAKIKDLLNGFMTLKSYRSEQKGVELFHSMNEEVEKKRFSKQFTFKFVENCTSILMVMIQVTVLCIGVVFAINGEILSGTVIIFVNLMNNIVSPLQEIPNLFAKMKAAKA